ncbi:hypothetical protein [Flavobacterium sp. ZS1P14]|uniref:pirin family protein n=1 Tax=Flavobacterium sp. ZS1P14 TaxID=3401729 RepID=UPI003AAEA9F7
MSQNGVYLFLIVGEIEVNNQILKARDAMEITDFDQFEIRLQPNQKYFWQKCQWITVQLLWKQQLWKSKTILLHDNFKLK